MTSELETGILSICVAVKMNRIQDDAMKIISNSYREKRRGLA